MKPGDLAVLRDFGVHSGEVVLILGVHEHKNWTSVVYLHDGTVFNETHSSFFEPIEREDDQ
jgi:hypothetical protein